MIKVKKLNCGIRVVMEEIPYLKSVSIGIWTRTGARDETERHAGISHLIEHMMFKGTEKRSAKQIASDADKIAGQMNAFTGKEATCYYMKTLASNIEEASDILFDMFLNSKFDEVELEKEKGVVREEMKMIEDTPDEYVHDMICEMIFENNPLSKSIIGTPESLENISREDIREYIKKEYTKDSIVIAIAGNFDEEKICNLIEAKFHNLLEEKPVKHYKEVPYTAKCRVRVKDTEQAHICMGTRGISLDDRRYYALALLNNILGGSMSSRLFQNIREEKGLAYSVYSMKSSFSDMGYFNIYAGVSHDKIEAVIKAIKEELTKLKDSGVTDEELSTAKEQLKGSYIFGQENVNGRMFSIGKNLTILNKVYTVEDIMYGVDNVTQDDMKEAINLISDVNNYCVAVVTDKEIPLEKYLEM